MSEEFNFRSDSYSGPIETILELIKKNRLNIYDLDISLITEQFLEYIETNAEKIGIDELSSFYQTASDLIYIKSRLLLPVETELDEEYEDPRAELVEKLLEYQVYKKYVDALSGNTGDKLYVPRNENFFMVPYDDSELFSGVDLHLLLETFVKLASKTKPAKIFNVYEEVTTDEKKALIIELIEKNGRVRIEDVIVKTDSKMHIACSFLAILEMAHIGIILITQDEPFGTVYITGRPENWITEPADEYEELTASKKRPRDASILDEQALRFIRSELKDESDTIVIDTEDDEDVE